MVTSPSIGKATLFLHILTQLYFISEPRIFVSVFPTLKLECWTPRFHMISKQKAFAYGTCAFQQRWLHNKTAKSKSYLSTDFHDKNQKYVPNKNKISNSWN